MSNPNPENIERIKSQWRPEEDDLLRKQVQKHGPRNWSLISESIPGRSQSSCRLRWNNNLSPEVKHGAFSAEEDEKIIRAHAQHGAKWAKIARRLKGRTGNAIKNRWNSTLKRICSVEGPSQVTGGNEGHDGNLGEEQTFIRTPSSGGVSSGFIMSPGTGSPWESNVSDQSSGLGQHTTVTSEVTTSSLGEDPSLTVPVNEGLQPNKNTITLDLFPVSKEEEEVEPKRISGGFSGELMMDLQLGGSSTPGSPNSRRVWFRERTKTESGNREKIE